LGGTHHSWSGGDPFGRESDIQDEPHDEEPDKEPSLGSRECLNQVGWPAGGTGDYEEEHDGSEFTWRESHGAGHDAGICSEDDKEPSLGWTISGMVGGTSDREEEHDREADPRRPCAGDTLRPERHPEVTSMAVRQE
jgi:hypothetical protein